VIANGDADTVEEGEMDIGVGLDATLNVSLAEQAELSKEAAQLGYTSIWTPESTGHDAFQLCFQRWSASREVVSQGLTTGIAVSPVMYRTPMAFSMSGATLNDMTGGRFIMGIGAGGAYRPRARRALGLPRLSALALMRDYLVTTRALVAGKQVDYAGEVITLQGMQLGIKPSCHTPVYLGALGPHMLRLAGELADGACLNWCSPEQIAWSRERIAEGAAQVHRDPSEIKMVEYIRICVDDDIDLARRRLALATMHYALGATVPTARERQLGYRAHFERMGFMKELAELDAMRQRGATPDEVADAFPPDVLQTVAYYGTANGAASAFKRLAQGLDTAIVRVVAARPGIASVRAVMQACSPQRVTS
jgi:alkanesulfonate monooxygenase SsuD/methylene tetrahydromethanopterin reductase-like flavin-dependent oxidoreductase (luciferase family)